MSKIQLFNLEKIKEYTILLEKVQVNLNELSEKSKIMNELIHKFEQENVDKDLSSKIEEIRDTSNIINNKLTLISKNNISKFLNFQDHLIKKYKDVFKEKLKSIYLDKVKTKTIGLYLIESKKISKIIDHVSYVSSIEIPYWLELLDSLKHNSQFVELLKKIKSYYQNLLRKNLKVEINKISANTDNALIEEFEIAHSKNPTLTFQEFLQDTQNQLTHQELIKKEEILNEAKKREELENLKKRQEKHKSTYEDYMKLSEREFKRLRRKERREKLIDVSSSSKETKELEISDEVTEKIKKFKLQFDKRFEEKYLVQKDDDVDPLDLIRKRKEKKEKEYKKYKNHFEKD
ncbi:hypothetical protein LCGC14_0968500 [marine sediment metagenome]|uniref:Uncharacterized protein n=1 Tax=marine sediment metagenome TaxID=412755 RepID=A0A0F9RIR3_9ZZZZ